MKKRKDIKKLLLALAVLLTFGIGQQLEPLQPVHAARQVKKSRKAKKGKKAKVSINANFPGFYNSMSKKPTITAFFEV